MERRRLLQYGFLAAATSFISRSLPARTAKSIGPVVISTWDAGVEANKGAWEVLSRAGTALDAVEKGVMVTEASQNCCVGLGGNPDREGIVTLDACIMDHRFNCGGVMFLERIKHPVSVLSNRPGSSTKNGSKNPIMPLPSTGRIRRTGPAREGYLITIPLLCWPLMPMATCQVAAPRAVWALR